MKSEDKTNIFKLSALMFNMLNSGKAQIVRNVCKNAYKELQAANEWKDVIRAK